jgi:hypothetical protein
MLTVRLAERRDRAAARVAQPLQLQEGTGMTKRSKPARVTCATAVVVAACVLTACGSTSQTNSSAQTTNASTSAAGQSSAVSASTTTQASATESSSSTGGPAAGSTAKLTAPGTRLKPGGTAIVEYDTILANGKDGPSWKLALTIDSIKAGSMSDFKGVTLTGVPKGSTPTYVKLRMTNLSRNGMKTGTNDPADAVQAIEHSGQGDSNLILTGYFPPCPDVDTPNPFAAGQTFTTCETFMEPGEATSIGYNGSSSTLDAPVIWSP